MNKLNLEFPKSTLNICGFNVLFYLENVKQIKNTNRWKCDMWWRVDIQGLQYGDYITIDYTPEKELNDILREMQTKVLYEQASLSIQMIFMKRFVDDIDLCGEINRRLDTQLGFQDLAEDICDCKFKRRTISDKDVNMQRK